MAARYVDVSESEIDLFKENVPQRTKEAKKFGVKLFKGRLIKFQFCKLTQFTENWYVCLHFLLQSVGNS